MQTLIEKVFTKLRLTGENGIYNKLPEKNRYLYIFGGLFVVRALIAKYARYSAKLTPKNCFLELDLDQLSIVNYNVPQQDSTLAKIFKKPTKIEFLHFLETLRTAAEDKNIAGIIIKMGIKTQFGMSQVEEIINEIELFRKNGKQTICYCDSIGFYQNGNLHYLLASACEKIYMQPTGTVNISGAQGKMPFLKQTLEKIGIKFEAFKRKNYKNAVNQLSEDKLDEFHREWLENVLQCVTNQINNYVSKNRNLTYEEVADAIKNGPWTPKEALEKKLIDGQKFKDEIYEELLDQKDKKLKPNFLFFTNYMAKKDRMFQKGKSNKQVAFINACGPIYEGPSKTPDMFSDELQIGADTLSRQIRKATKDKNIIGIILRVDSPGGSVIASELINREIKRAQKAGKKVLAIYSNVSASGGVYISCLADKIIATPLTITGSIGVIFGKFAFREMFQKMGVTYDFYSIKDQPESNYYGAIDETTENDKILINKQMDQMYNRFVELVAEGRKQTKEEILEKAQGRVWMGGEAQERNLIDELQQGAYLNSVEQIAKLTDTEVKDIKIVHYPKQTSLLSSLLQKPSKNELEQDQKEECMVLQKMASVQTSLFQGMLGNFLNLGPLNSIIKQIILGGQQQSSNYFMFSSESTNISNIFGHNDGQNKNQQVSSIQLY